MIGLAGLVGYYFTKLPPIDQLAVPKRAPNVAILASDGSLIANRGETGGRTVALSELPPYAPKAFVAIEDRRFYSHFGIDPIGLARALAVKVWRRGHGGLQGGSTLTQQLAKNLFLTQERTVSRKIQEAILAVWLERNYTKSQILELYSTASISAPAPTASKRRRSSISQARPLALARRGGDARRHGAGARARSRRTATPTLRKSAPRTSLRTCATRASSPTAWPRWRSPIRRRR